MTDANKPVVVVTGGAGGIGQVICTTLAAEGCCVVVADINVEGAEQVAESCGGVARRVDQEILETAIHHERGARAPVMRVGLDQDRPVAHGAGLSRGTG